MSKSDSREDVDESAQDVKKLQTQVRQAIVRYKSSIMFLDTAKLNAQIQEDYIEKARLQKIQARMSDLVKFGIASENVIEINKYLSLQPKQLAEKLNKLMFASQRFSSTVYEAVVATEGFLEQVEPALRSHVTRQN